ncbi:hypothetical protein EVAR_86516_1 [Eumeta japonica]|uniref:Uncharacterized protein n=1 Tax=Eumeta variegata TaxID=151549 RepID=A0A4C1VPA1_EUMVA|nr:hypothetical protein EVAR_86516_1 [Eumeta japonica]
MRREKKGYKEKENNKVQKYERIIRGTCLTRRPRAGSASSWAKQEVRVPRTARARPTRPRIVRFATALPRRCITPFGAAASARRVPSGGRTPGADRPGPGRDYERDIINSLLQRFPRGRSRRPAAGAADLRDPVRDLYGCCYCYGASGGRPHSQVAGQMPRVAGPGEGGRRRSSGEISSRGRRGAGCGNTVAVQILHERPIVFGVKQLCRLTHGP